MQTGFSWKRCCVLNKLYIPCPTKYLTVELAGSRECLALQLIEVAAAYLFHHADDVRKATSLPGRSNDQCFRERERWREGERLRVFMSERVCVCS